MITTLDKPTVLNLQNEMLTAMQAVAAKHGLTVINKGGTFSQTSTMMKFEVVTCGKTGEPQTREREDFKRLASVYGLQATDLDRTFVFNGSIFQVVGLKFRTVSPVLCKRADGKVFKFYAANVKGLLGPSCCGH